MTSRRPLSVRLYAILLRVLLPHLEEEYRAEAVQVFADLRMDAVRPGRGATSRKPCNE